MTDTSFAEESEKKEDGKCGMLVQKLSTYTDEWRDLST